MDASRGGASAPMSRITATGKSPAMPQTEEEEEADAHDGQSSSHASHDGGAYGNSAGSIAPNSGARAHAPNPTPTLRHLQHPGTPVRKCFLKSNVSLGSRLILVGAHPATSLSPCATSHPLPLPLRLGQRPRGEDGAAGAQQPVLGAGRKAADCAGRKPRKKRTRLFNPKWMEQYDWLQTFPNHSQAQWEERPDEDPQHVTCAACHAFPKTAHKDVIFKHPPGKLTLRSDKLVAHQSHVAHERAVHLWRARMKAAPTPTPAPTDSAEAPADLGTVALRNLMRTVMTTVVHKGPVSFVKTLVALQVANQTTISTSHMHSTNGVQSFLHAAMLLLQGQQNERLRRGGMLSDMGDGSTDRKMIEQEIIYVKYPVCRGDMTKSLNGLRFTCEYLDLVEVDVRYSLDKKSFDARAVLRSTYHTTYLQRGLASLPEPEPEPEPEPDGGLAEATRARSAGERPSHPLCAAPAPLKPCPPHSP